MKNYGLCSICGLGYEGHGNNAWPLKEKRCCDDCNKAFVIIARLQHMDRISPVEPTKERDDETETADTA